MPPALVVDCANLLGWREPAMLTFTNQQGRDISDSNPQDADSDGILDDNSIIIHPAIEIPGMDVTMDPVEIAEVDPDFDIEPPDWIWTLMHWLWTPMSQLRIMLLQ
jgi:hypothetical protein